MYTNTAWMLDGAPCWVQIGEDYERGHIQKLLNQRSVARVLLTSNKILDVPTNQLLKASNSKVNDLTELSHINDPEVLYKIKNTVYLDRLVLLQNVSTSLADYIQYRKYIDERLIVSNIPPHIFSSLFYAYHNLDLGKNTQIFVTGNKGYGKTTLISELVKFMNKDNYYNLIKAMITDSDNHTQGTVNYRFIFRQKRMVGLLVQLYYLNVENYKKMQFFSQKWEDIGNQELLNLIQGSVENGQQYLVLLEKVILFINGLVQLNDNIQIISILETPGKSDALTTYIQEKVEQIYLQFIFKTCQQQLIQDQLQELYKQISFEDNLNLIEELESQNQFPQNIIKLNNLINKDTQLLFIRLLQNKEDLVQFRIADSIKFFKNSYSHRLTFNEFYLRFHHLDTFNRKISLQKHLNSNQDMKALVTEICKRLTQLRGIVFGQTQIYFKKEAIENLNKLLCSHNLKLSQFAKIIQRAYRISKFKKVILACVKKIAKSQSIDQGILEEIQQSFIDTEPHKMPQQRAEEEIVFEESDPESYKLLTESQVQQYREIKISHLKNKQQCLLNGQLIEEIQDVAFNLLNEDQRAQREKNIQKLKFDQQVMELENIQNDVSDKESFQLLTMEQKFQYLIMKKQNQTQVAFRLLDQQQQHQIKQKKRLNKITEFQQKYYEQLEPFLSDLEGFKQLTIGQQNEYKQRKLDNNKSVAISLLNEQQLINRRQIIINSRPRQQKRKQFMVEDDLSDFQSFELLLPIQKQLYKKEKTNYKPIKLLQNKVRFGYQYDISDGESFQLLSNKDKYIEYKEKMSLCQDISDIEAYLALSDVEQYKNQKKEGNHNTLKTLANKQKYEQLMQLRFQAQQRLDELRLVRYDLLDSIAFKLLNNEEWEQRKQLIIEFYKRKEKNVEIGNFLDDVDSVAYRLLTIEQKNERKQIERNKIMLKQIINPILFENFLHPDSSVAFRLLQNKDKVYYQISLAYSLLKDKSIRNQQLKELQVYPWEEYNNLAQKQQLLQDKISKYEQEKQNREDFSDYEAYKLLDEDQLLEYKQNAYQLLDDEQKQIHRRILKGKLTKTAQYSDLESFEMLSDNSKETYKNLKNDEISDYCAYEALESKEQYQQQKLKKQEVLKQIEEKGFKIYFGINPQVMAKEDYDIFMKKQQQRWNKVQEEEQQLMKQFQQQQLQRQLSRELPKTFIVQKLIQNPKSQPYIIYDNCQLHTRILDIRSAPDKNLSFFIDNEFMDKLEKNTFLDYCQQVLHHEGKQVNKIMKNQNENLKHPLTKLSSEGTALNVFRSILKFSHMKRSRLTTKQHLERILCALIGNTAHIELPPPPKSLIRAQAVDFDSLKKTVELETAGRKFSGQDEFDTSLDIREEVLLQIFKQIEGNKKENLYYLLRLCIVITHCIAFYNPIPFIQFLIEKIESADNKVFKDPEIYKYSKQLIKNLAVNVNEQVFKNEEKVPLSPRVYLPSSQELQIMFECKQPIVKLFLHSDTPIWISVDHHFSVKSAIKSACQYIGQQSNWNNYGLLVVQSKGDQIINTSWMDESSNFFDILNKLQYHEEINNNFYKLYKTFEIYLSIKQLFSFHQSDLDVLDLVFYQMAFDVKRSKIQLKSEELQVLSQLEMYIKMDINIGNHNYQDKNSAKLEYLKILKLADNNCIPEIASS